MVELESDIASRHRGRRRGVSLAVAALVVVGVVAGALAGLSRHSSTPHGGDGYDATDGQIVSVAQRYFSRNVHLPGRFLASRRGSECAAVMLQTTGGQVAGVILVLQGDPPPSWQPVGMSSAYTLRRFVDSGDSLCNLASILDDTSDGRINPPLTFGVNWHRHHK